jgi:hypothetical protein
MSDSQETNSAIGHGVRRLCIAVDLEHYSQRSDTGQIEAQRAMSALLHRAGENGALERALWLIQPQGDGELALLPPGIDEAYVITSLMQQVSSGLHEYNRIANDTARLRMRIAVHEGVTYVADSGFAGDAINTVCRLRDAPESKEALRTAASDLVLIASARIFQDVICGSDAYGLPPDDFREAEIVMADKGFRAQAFIFAAGTPGSARPQAAAAGEPQPEQNAEPTPQDGNVSIKFGKRARVRDFAGRDMYKGQAAGPATEKAVYQVRDE